MGMDSQNINYISEVGQFLQSLLVFRYHKKVFENAVASFIFDVAVALEKIMDCRENVIIITLYVISLNVIFMSWKEKHYVKIKTSITPQLTRIFRYYYFCFQF